jgi:2Fe-2S ferredoxin
MDAVIFLIHSEGLSMGLLRVTDRNGNDHEVDAQLGSKLMERLRDLDYGVAAICGGMCSCATCHVDVAPEWLSRLSAPMSDEKDLLAELTHRQSNSRLSCQIDWTADLAGLSVTIAPQE